MGGAALIKEGFVVWLHQENPLPPDYKVHCFHGVPKIILICADRFSEEGMSEVFYDSEWNKLDMKRADYQNKKDFQPPACIKRILEISAILSKRLPFIRVDFFIINDHPYVGELTFYPASGLVPFTPDKWDRILGDWIVLPGMNQ